jgi:ADP-heptose:LPS heptosyltransferase
MKRASKILVIRFSAMGDVALTVPVLREFSQHYPDAQIVMASRGLFEPFFKDITPLTFHTFDPKNKHKGFLGLLKYFWELKQYRITAVADLHNNLRSNIISILFFLCGKKVCKVDKGREDKKKLTRQLDKILVPLQLTSERYSEVFSKLGFPFKLTHQLKKQKPDEIDAILQPLIGMEKTEKWIGVSPFAQHQQKVYPLEKMEIVLLHLAELGYKLFIFGGGVEEQKIAAQWEVKHKNIISVINKINLSAELQLISHLDLMISMDSSGMHLASLKGIPVISIWGSTHPYAGFLGYGQSINDTVQIDLECRPCSIYGNIPCFRGDFACMNNLSPLIVVDKVIEKLNG